MAGYDSENGQPSKMQAADLKRRLKAWWKADSAHSAAWRKEAREDNDFVVGHGQWTAEERAELEATGRVPITFNRVLAFIKSVAGTEINGRHEVRYIPRTSEDTKPNEVLTAASQWMSDSCDAEDEESEAFQNSMICGMGFTENRLDYELDPEGMYVEESINPLEMYWDCKARKKNLVDARRMWRARKMLISEARSLFPDVPDDDLDAKWAGDVYTDANRTEEEKRRREENTEYSDDYNEVTIIECQWWEREPYWLIADPMSGEKAELTETEYQTLTKRLKEMSPEAKVDGVKLQRRAYKRAYIGGEILGEVKAAPCKDHFSWQCITGEPDKNAGTWFGLVRVARDPQKWANKWLCQTLHILNASAKGGIMAETDAFEDQRQAEESWAKHQRITWMKKGALSGQSGAKWAEKPVAQFPGGYFNLMQFAFDAVPQVLGINMEMMGMRDVNQPGVLEAHRKQAAMTILATMFDSLRRFRKNVGRVRLYFIQEYFSDGRLIRVVGQDGAKTVPLVKDQTAGKYDVIVDDAPTSPNQKEATWAILVQMLPVFKDQLMAHPELAVEILEYSPVPSAMLDKIKGAMSKPDPEAEKARAIAEAGAVAKVKRDEAAATKDLALAGKAVAGDQAQPTGGPLDLQTALAQLQKLAADISKVMAETAKVEAETSQIKTETALAPAELVINQNNQTEQNDIKRQVANRPVNSAAA